MEGGRALGAGKEFLLEQALYRVNTVLSCQDLFFSYFSGAIAWPKCKVAKAQKTWAFYSGNTSFNSQMDKFIIIITKCNE